MKTLNEKYVIKQMSIEKLTLDIDNARWEGTAKNEKDAITKLFEVVKKKPMQNLINNFAKRLTQDLPLLAIQLENKTIIKDGNRRLYALKFLSGQISNPDLAMSKNKQINKSTKVNVQIYNDINDLHDAIVTIHGSSSSGGLMGYGSIEKQRIKSKSTIKRWPLTLIDNVNSTLGKNKIKTDEILFTNFERMINSREVKKYFRIVVKDGGVSYDLSKTNEIAKLIRESKNLTVKKIYEKNQAANKVKEILDLKELKPSKTKSSKVVTTLMTTKMAKTKKTKMAKSKKLLLNSSLSKITTQMHFYNFSKSLTDITYPKNLEISIPLYRVLIDYSVRFYCDENKIQTTEKVKNKTIDKRLMNILPNSLEHMRNNGMEKAVIDRIMEEIEKKAQIQ